VDRQPATIVELEDNDFEQVCVSIRPEEQRLPRFVISLLQRVAGERTLDCVNDVFITDAVLARRGMNLHT